ncbi:hypothetical protein pb186bvf_011421 [Paramecium bursaria]
MILIISQIIIIQAFSINQENSQCNQNVECEQYQIYDNICKDFQECKICKRKPFYDEFIQFSYGYGLLIPLIGMTTIVGMGVDQAKTTVLMLLLYYSHYEATILSYAASLGANLLFFTYSIVYLQQSNLVDLDILLLIFVYLFAGTDLGNYFNRQIYDFAAVLIILIAEIFAVVCLAHKYFLQLEEDIQQHIQSIDESNKNMIISQAINNLTKSLIKSSSIHPEENNMVVSMNLNKVSKTSNLLSPQFYFIISGQLVLQIIILFRGGQTLNIFDITYGEYEYWIYTVAVYLISILMYVAISCYLRKVDKKLRQSEDKNYFSLRSYNIQTFIVTLFIGFTASFISGLLGVGFGIIFTSSMVILQLYKMNPEKAVLTLSFAQILMNISTMEQTLLVQSINNDDLAFFFLLGMISAIFGLYIKSKIKGIPYQSRLILIMCVLMGIDIICSVLYFVIRNSDFTKISWPEFQFLHTKMETIGFGAAGVVKGSLAAGAQSMIGNVAAGSIFAACTSIGMTGGLSLIGLGAILLFGPK